MRLYVAWSLRAFRTFLVSRKVGNTAAVMVTVM